MVMQRVASDDIKQMGTNIGNLASTLTPAITGLKNITVSPGNFVDADTLKKTIMARAQEAVTLCQNVSGTLGVIGKDLVTTAGFYVTTEDGNKHKADELDALIKDAEDKLPGISKQTNTDVPNITGN